MLLWGCIPEFRWCACCGRRFRVFQGSDERFCKRRCEENGGQKKPAEDLFAIDL